MSNSMRLKTASVLLLMSAAATSAAPTVIALSGTAAPGGGTFTGGFTNPTLNSTGLVAFNANITGGTSTSGIFTNASGSLQAAALQGTAAPAGGNYANLYSSATTTADVLNSSGELAFTAPLTAGTSTSGVFTDIGGTVTAVAVNNTAAPSGGNFNAFLASGIDQAYSPTLNNSGTLAIQSTLTGGTPSPGTGIFYGATAATLQTYALVGAPAPADVGGNYNTTVTVPTINSIGQIAFVALAGNPAKQGIFAGSPGSIQTVMYQGNPAPGTTAYSFQGLSYGTPTTTYSFNNLGQVGFISSITGGSLGQPTSGVFAGAPGSVANIALNNTLAPGGTGGNYTTLSNVTVSNAGLTTFNATLTGGTSASGIFQGTAASVIAVALAGGTAPDGATYSSFASATVQNDLGQVAFLTNLLIGGTTNSANSVELDAGTPGNLAEIARTGDQISVDSGPLRIISGFGFLGGTGDADGKGAVLNDLGEIAYRVTFTDGSSAIVESTIPNPVPEPASIGLIAMSAGLLMRRNRSRLVIRN
jgi:hypothetical protein